MLVQSLLLIQALYLLQIFVFCLNVNTADFEPKLTSIIQYDCMWMIKSFDTATQQQQNEIFANSLLQNLQTKVICQLILLMHHTCFKHYKRTNHCFNEFMTSKNKYMTMGRMLLSCPH